MTQFCLIMLQAAQGAGGGMGSMLLMILLLVAVMYFFMIRPQNKKQREIQKFRNSLQPGQEVVTVGGLRGTVRSIDETEGTITLEVATGVKLKFEKTAIMPQGQSQQA